MRAFRLPFPFAAAAALVAVLWLGPAAAVEEADRTAGQAVIERQLDAFKRDDAAAAYGLASPGIQGMFGSGETFMEMVRKSYRPVYKPRRFAFGPARDAPEGFEQALEIQDGEGVDWDAVYSLERQPDGSWRISGCRLVKRPGDSV